MMPTARVLANVVDQLDSVDMADHDTKGDLYEYMHDHHSDTIYKTEAARR